MGLETFTGAVSALVPTNPVGGDPPSQGDDHIRGIKKTIIEGVVSNTGGTLTGQLKGITPVANEDLTRKDYVDGKVSTAVNDAKVANQAFSARSTSSQGVTTATATKVTLAESFDLGGVFATSRFTPTSPGYYQFNGIVRGSATNLTAVSGQIQQNGVAIITSTDIQAAITGAVSVSMSCLLPMNGSTDYVELWGSVTGSSPAFDGGTVGQNCQLSGFKVRDL